MSGEIRPDHNGGLSGEVFTRHVRKLSALDKKMDALKKDIKAAEKDAKDDGVIVKELREAVKEAQEDPQVLVDRLNRKIKMLDWLRSPFGRHVKPVAAIDDTIDMSDEQRFQHWKDQGFQAGLRGENRDRNPHDANALGGAAWNEGWQEGQDENLSKIVELKPKGGRKTKASAPPAPPPEEPQADAGSDEVDGEAPERDLTAEEAAFEAK